MKRLLLIFSVLTICAAAFIILSTRRSMTWDEWVQRHVHVPEVKENSTATAIDGGVHETEQRLNPEWEKWVDEQTQLVMDSNAVLEKLMAPDFRENLSELYLTDEEYLTKLREAMRAQFAAKAQELKNEYFEPPQELIALSFNFEFDLGRVPIYIYDGPQTVKALMETFDEEYFSLGAVQEIDEKYPRADWLQMFVDNGYDILDHNDYRAALGLRYDVESIRNDPDQWTSGLLRIPPTDDWETYKAVYIEKQVSMFQRFNTATREDPEYTGGFIPYSNPEVFLRYNGKRVYVMRNGLATSYFGRELTDEQRYNLTHQGIHPEGIEVIYIDDDYNVLTQRPALITPDMEKVEVPSFITPDMLKNVELPPHNWKPPKDWDPPPGLEEALRANGWGGSFAPQDVLPPDVLSVPNNNLVEQNEKAPQAAQEQFENAQRDFDRFAGMSDAELEAEFEKMFMEQFPELITQEKVESAFREQFKTKHVSPERFNRALDILDRHGPEKGLRRLREVDPEAATQIEQILFSPSEEQEPPPAD